MAYALLPLLPLLSAAFAAQPLGSEPAWSVEGMYSDVGVGGALASVGDVNGDGFDDMAIASTSVTGGGGRVRVYHGSVMGPGTTASWSCEGEPDSNLGSAVAGAGDVNGDGYDDLVVGASHDAGSAMVFLGSASGLASEPCVSWTGSEDADMGASVAGVGDVNDDGYDDVVVGGPGAYEESGAVWVFLGSATGPSATAAMTWRGGPGDGLGMAVAGAGDVNGDGYDDVVVGGMNFTDFAGSAVLFLGSATGPSSASAARWTSDTYWDMFGTAVIGAGDLDGDGYDDIAVGDPMGDLTGSVSIFYGSSDVSRLLPGTTLQDPRADWIASHD